VISVLGSLYGAVTVGLAAIFLKEHVSRWQWLESQLFPGNFSHRPVNFSARSAFVATLSAGFPLLIHYTAG